MRRSKIVKLGLAMAAMAAMLVTSVGYAVPTTSCNQGSTFGSLGSNGAWASQGASCVLEPLLTRSDAAPVYVNDNDIDNLGEANIKNFTLTSGGGKLTATITTAEFIPTNITELVGDGLGKGVRAPYGGVHVLALFQTPQLEIEQVTGTTLSGGNSTFGPYRLQDNFHWFFYYGVTASEAGNPTCGWGVYDQFGQVFFVSAQNHDSPKNFACSNNKGTKTVTLTFPYTTTYTLQPDGLPRRIEFVKPGQRVTNAKAFSWMDHEVGGPPPVGLVIGATHYTDVVPNTGYDFGAWVGDPNSGGVPGPNCNNYSGVRVPNPLYNGAPCYISLQGNGPTGVGLGMRPTSLNFTAA